MLPLLLGRQWSTNEGHASACLSPVPFRGTYLASEESEHNISTSNDPTNEDDLQKYHSCVDRISVVTSLVAVFALYRSSHNLFFWLPDYPQPAEKARLSNVTSISTLAAALLRCLAIILVWPTCRTPAVGGLTVCEWVCVSEEMSPYCSAHD